MNRLRRSLPTLARALDALKRARVALEPRLKPLGRGLVGQLQRVDLRDVAVFGGLAAVTYGVRQVYSPAAWIVFGGFFMWISLRGKTE